MRSTIDLTPPLISVTGTWYHAATRGYPGRILRLTPRGFTSAAGYEPTRFNPGNVHGVGSSFETLYLALDGRTALFEKRVNYGDPYGDPSALLVMPRISKTELVPVDVNVDSILDLSDVDVHRLLGTNAQEITGDWEGYVHRGSGAPDIVLTAPIGSAPTQDLAWELFHHTSVKGIKSISAQVPTTCCLVVFTHKLRSSNQLSWSDPNTGRRETYP
jgi:hypothetical protein